MARRDSFQRGAIPLICKQTNELELWHTNGSGDTADFRVDFPAQYAGKVYWEMSTPGASGEMIVPVTSGADINFQPQVAGPHRAILKGVPVDQITYLDASSDKISCCISKLCELRSVTNVSLQLNPSLIGDISTLIPYMSYIGTLYLYSSAVSGDIGGIVLPGTMMYLRLDGTNVTVGSPFNVESAGLRLLRIYNCSLIESHVDNVIESIWNARASFTYATPELNVGGTNAPPSGSYVAPSEGADWHDDGGTWIPLTGAAMAYDLVNDVNSEGFNKWTCAISS